MGESIDSNIPRETDIALDVFGKNDKYNSSDGLLVRSHIYALWQKLQKFYLIEGKEETIRLVIRKGRNEVVFIDAPRLSLRPKSSARWSIGAAL